MDDLAARIERSIHHTATTAADLTEARLSTTARVAAALSDQKCPAVIATELASRVVSGFERGLRGHAPDLPDEWVAKNLTANVGWLAREAVQMLAEARAEA